jgi:hypothetical protein
MKKNTEKKLKINKKAVAELNRKQMDQAKGGTSYPTQHHTCKTSWCGYGTCLATGSCSR